MTRKSFERKKRDWISTWNFAKARLHAYALFRFQGVRAAFAAISRPPRMSSHEDLIQEAWRIVVRREVAFDPSKFSAYRFWCRYIDEAASIERNHARKRGEQLAKQGLRLISSDTMNEDRLAAETALGQTPAPEDRVIFNDFLKYLSHAEPHLVEIAEAMYNGAETNRDIMQKFQRSERWARSRRRSLEQSLLRYIHLEPEDPPANRANKEANK